MTYAYHKANQNTGAKEDPSTIKSTSENGDAGIDLDTLRGNLRNIIVDRYRSEILCDIPGLESDFDIMFSNAVKASKVGPPVDTTWSDYTPMDSTAFTEEMVTYTSAAEGYALLTPPSSKQVSPQLEKKDLQSFIGLPLTPESMPESPYTPLSGKNASHTNVELDTDSPLSSITDDLRTSQWSSPTTPMLASPINEPYAFGTSIPADISPFNFDSPLDNEYYMSDPFLGPSTPLSTDTDLAFFPVVAPADMTTPHSAFMSGNAGFDMHEWLQMDTWALVEECTEEQVRSVCEGTDGLF